MITYGKVSDRDAEGTLTRGVQQFHVGKRASATSREWDDGMNLPPIFRIDGLPASRALAVLLLPESLWESASLQPLRRSSRR